MCGARLVCRLALAVLAGGLGSLPASAATYERPCLDCDFPFAWDDGAAEPPVVGPFPQGFALTVPVSPGSPREAAAGARMLDRYADVAVALGRCWSSSLAANEAQWIDLTLRVSFRRDGAVNGRPAVVHVTSPSDPEARERGRQSLLTALGRCTPLPFSASLGRAIAGQIFAIRFVQQRNS